jgi:hypothetical protein
MGWLICLILASPDWFTLSSSSTSRAQYRRERMTHKHQIEVTDRYEDDVRLASLLCRLKITFIGSVSLFFCRACFHPAMGFLFGTFSHLLLLLDSHLLLTSLTNCAM